jgi:hypothetical protein
MGTNLHNQMSNPARTVFKYLVISFCVAVFVDIDHLLCGRGLQHEPVVLLVGCLIFMGVTFVGRLFKSRILK